MATTPVRFGPWVCRPPGRGIGVPLRTLPVSCLFSLRFPIPSLIAALAMALCGASLAGTGTERCQVPADYPSLQAALDDMSCDPIQIDQPAIAGDAFIGRSVTISGRPGDQSRILGQVVISGSDTDVVLRDLHVDTSVSDLAGCFDQAVFVMRGANVRASNLRLSNVAGNGSCLFVEQVFSDGFE